jgi:hypothetical protein
MTPGLSAFPLPGLQTAVLRAQWRTCLPTDIVAFVVFCRLMLRDLSDIHLLRGIEVS